MERFHELEIEKIKKETNDAVSIWFNISNDKEFFRFDSGQYVNLKKKIDGKEIIRSYSIWKAPHENTLSVLVKKVEGGLFSTYANAKLKEGEKIQVSSPQGNFNLKEGGKLVFFAAGSGITPILSMITDVLYTKDNLSVVLYYASRNRENIVFNTELDKLKRLYPSNFDLKTFLTREDTGLDLFNGRIDKEKCRRLVNEKELSLNADGYYLCGPEEMIFSIKDFLKENKVNQEKIFFELFTTPTSNDKNNFDNSLYEGNVSVKLIVDDDEFQYMYNPASSESILDAGIENGVDLPFSCKGGVCCTCRAKVIEGKAKMNVNYALTDEEVEEGYILTCQAHALSSNITVDFDE